MGLEEKRIQQEFVKTRIPERLARFKIEAVAVHEAGALASAQRMQRPAPSRLEIDRKAAEIQKAVAQFLGRPVAFQVAWDETPRENGPALLQLEDLLTLGADVLLQIVKDPAGKEEVSKLRSVKVSVGSALSAKRDGEALVLVADKDRGVPLSRDALRSVIEAAL